MQRRATPQLLLWHAFFAVLLYIAGAQPPRAPNFLIQSFAEPGLCWQMQYKYSALRCNPIALVPCSQVIRPFSTFTWGRNLDANFSRALFTRWDSIVLMPSDVAGLDGVDAGGECVRAYENSWDCPPRT